MSDSSPGVIGVRRLRARAFMGHSMRTLMKPECISALTARATALASRSRGNPLCVTSAMYSQIARESHTHSGPLRRTGTRPLGPYRSAASLNSGVSRGSSTSLNSTPRCFSSIHGRSDQEE